MNMNGHQAANEPSPTLVDMLSASKCTLVAGPLISLAPSEHLGPPSPAWLAFELAERMGRKLDNYELHWVAQLYADREGINALRSWVAQRLYDPRFRPTLSHHLIAQMPFLRIVYTAQDRLLEQAFDVRDQRATFVFPEDSTSFSAERLVVLPYGSAEQPETLKLTEDERRRVFDVDIGPVDDLRTWARSDALLFLGYTLNDPLLLDLYYRLRPQDSRDLQKLPRAHLVGPGATPDHEKYWSQHNASLYTLETSDFLLKLAQKLDQKGNLPAPIDLSIEQPPLLGPQERQQRDQLRARFAARSGLSEWVETGAELRRTFEPHQMIEIQMGAGGQKVSAQLEAGNRPASKQDETAALNQLQSGNIEWSQGNLELARTYFEGAMQRDPQLTDAYLSLYHLLIEKGDLDGAYRVYQQLLQQAPQQALLPERYQIREILGQIDLGVSYCVHDQEHNQTATVTILRRTFSLQEEALAQFARQMSALSSPRISRILGFDRHRGRTYMLSEYIEGQTLRERLKLGGALPYQEAMQIAAQVAEALDDGHRQGIPHLDLQPANILLTSEGAKLVNYGYSRLARGSGRMMYASPSNYLAPEQLAGDEGDARSDTYALGTILYEMLTGHAPGVGSFQHPSEVNLQVTEAVDVLIDHARERYPNQRFASPGEMRKEITRITLSALNKKPNQYLRIGLTRVSQAYERLAFGKGLILLLLALAALLTVSLVPAIPAGFSLAARLLFPLLLNSLLVSVLVDWAVRAVARRRGLGSLITGGRGMGAILGLMFTLNLISILGLDTMRQSPATEVLGIYAATLAVVLFLTALALGIILGAARVAQRWWKSYTSGFYWSFVVIVAIELLLTALRQPAGLIR